MTMICAGSTRLLRFSFAAFLGSLMAFTATGGEWPQYRGPNHDGVSADRINKQWTGAVTNPVWRVRCTNGLSSVAVSGGRVFTQIRRNLGGTDREVCLALSAANGMELWATNVDDADYSGGTGGSDDGPRSTPSVDAGSVYVLSSHLKLYRLNATNGAVIWNTNLVAGFGDGIIEWQNAASPLVGDGLIFLNASAGNSKILALRTTNGELAWRSQNERMTHATPVLATIHGVRQLIFATQSGLLALNPQTGERLWRFSYPFDYSTSLAVSPVVYEDLVFATGGKGYGMGSFVARVIQTNNTLVATQLWSNTGYSALASIWMTPVAHGGFLYGQFDGGQLKCVDMRTGAVRWSASGFGRGGTLLVDNHLLALTENGQLVLVQPNTNAYTEVARCAAITNYSSSNNRCWNVPAVSGGKVFLRSTGYAASFDFSVPDLKLDPPQFGLPDLFQLTIRTADGSPLNSNRLAAMEVKAATNLAQPSAQWTKLTNALVLTNGLARLTNVDARPPRQFFHVSEPK